MIQSFADADSEQLFREEMNRRFNAVARVALRKWIQMNRAGKLEDLKVPPGNRLEALKGNLAGYPDLSRRARGSFQRPAGGNRQNYQLSRKPILIHQNSTYLPLYSDKFYRLRTSYPLALRFYTCMMHSSTAFNSLNFYRYKV